MAKDIENVLSELEDLLTIMDDVTVCPYQAHTPIQDAQNLDRIHSEIKQRIEFIGDSITKTLLGSKEGVENAILLFRDWMVHGTIVRVIGAGRARLAGSIPANRLAHGGARVYIQDEIIPMPHSIKGGGIIAVSASGKTPAVISVLESVRKKYEGNIKIVGIADKDAIEFQDYCDIFIGIDQDIELTNPLQALADTGEYIIS
jgi:D-arabinose 5-phosphate isomerase GutQ